MQNRLAAPVETAKTVQLALMEFYVLLSNEQKVRFNTPELNIASAEPMHRGGDH